MMDISRFLQQGARYMAADRPDIWGIEEAFEQLVSMYSMLAGQNESGEVFCGGFALQKFYDEEDGTVEYHLMRKILEFSFFEDDGDTLLTDWIDCSALSNIGLDIPDHFHEDFDNDS